MSDGPDVKRLKGGRVECVVTFTEAEIAPAEEKALHELSRDIELPGFRKGNVPMDQAKEKIDPQKLFEATVHHILPPAFEKLIKEQDIKPIIHPQVEAVTREPLTLKIVFIEKPEVSLKGVNKIKIEKKNPEVDEKELQKMIDFVLDKNKQNTEVDREAKQGDMITMNFYGTGEDKKEIEGIRTEGHQVEIGSKVLIPGFEDNLKGVKKGEEKEFTLTFPEKYHAEQLQNKPVTFHVTVVKVEEVLRPELTDEFAKKELQAESVEDFKKQVKESMQQQEVTMESQRRERLLMEELTKCTKVELAAELIDEETRQMVGEFEQQLGQQGMNMEQWMQASGKKPEEVLTDMKAQAEQRLTLRLGMQQLVEEKDIDVTDEEMDQIVEGFLGQATPEQRKEVESAYQKGAQAYEQLKWQKKVEKALEGMLA
ncbi:MAG: trigger factor [Candidatus Peribacteraceae bacterium]|jgi:trigger factor|nr:trigger factor [bacterium]MDP6561303.1 trigger factor [Candidatus Peribacteraceae bacterium]|tara:strand:+ start:116 stop:1393 length:1278 start_codon:yes stop_codon:yes gene_type:complete